MFSGRVLDMTKLFLTICLILFALPSLGKVGDRFNCFLIDARYLFHIDKMKEFEIGKNKSSKRIMISILPNNKAELIHDFGENEFEFSYDGKSNTYIISYSLGNNHSTSILSSITNKEWRYINTSINYDEVIVSKYSCKML